MAGFFRHACVGGHPARAVSVLMVSCNHRNDNLYFNKFDDCTIYLGNL